MTVEITGIDKLTGSLSALGGSAMNKAMASALNKTTTTAKSEMSKAVRNVYNIKKKDLDPHIVVNKATKANHSVVITVKTKSIGLIHFNATASKARDKGQKRYFKTSAKVMKSERKKAYKGAFIANVNGSPQVFRRTTRKRLPIIKLTVITPTTMTHKEGLETFEKVFSEKMNDTFFHELDFFLSKEKK